MHPGGSLDQYEKAWEEEKKMSMIDKAISFATLKHEGQRDKAGLPFILHPMRVMQNIYDMGEEYACAAILHDVLEDCDVKTQELFDLGMSPPVVWAVDALSHRKYQGETYEQFIERCKINPIARAVKAQDIMDNMSRMDHFNSDLKVAELRNKYKWAMKELFR